MVKLDDISADFVATLPGAEILDRVLPWADELRPGPRAVCCAPSATWRCGRSPSSGVDTDKPRKDLRKWADFRPVYGFFFPEIFELVTDPADERFGGLDPDLVRAIGVRVRRRLLEPRDPAWRGSSRSASSPPGSASRCSRRSTRRTRTPTPARSPTSPVIRVLITGSRRSPDLGQVCAALGEPEVLRRARALS